MSKFRFLKNISGATAIEYCLIAALIALVILTAVQNLGQQTSTRLNTVATRVISAR